MALRLKIITPKGIFFDEDIEIVTVKTSEGYIGILKNHIPLVANLDIAEMFIKQAHKKYTLHVSSGILFSTKTEVKILTDYVDYDSEVKKSLSNLSKVRHSKIIEK